MNTALSEAIKEAFAITPADDLIYHTLEIRQVGIQSTVYLVQAQQPLVATDETNTQVTYIPSGFAFSLPPSNEDGFQSLTIAIDNVNQEAMDFIKLATGNKVPVEVLYRPYLASDLTKPQMIPPLLLYLTDVSVDTTTVTGTCTFMDVVNKKFPSELYTRTRFPTLQ